MKQQLPWVHGELSWLSGPLYRVHSAAWPLVDEFLNSWNYRRVALNGRAMTSNFHAHAELHTAFGFPNWCGHNWDAFDDCFGDYVQENDGARVAVIWRDIDIAAREAPATTAEVGRGLLHCKFVSAPSPAHATQRSVTLDIFVIGDGPDFCSPG